MGARQAIRVVVTRRFEAAPERIFDAWLRRELMEQWMFGPAVRDEEILHLAVDPRAGGGFSCKLEQDDEVVEHTGTYLDVVRPRRLAFSWMVEGEPAGSRVQVDIEPRGAGAELTVIQELHPARAAEVAGREAGWEQMLDALAEALAAEAERLS